MIGSIGMRGGKMLNEWYRTCGALWDTPLLQFQRGSDRIIRASNQHSPLSVGNRS